MITYKYKFLLVQMQGLGAKKMELSIAFILLSPYLNSRDEKKVKKVLTENKVELLNYWNKHTNGLTVDLNQVLKTIEY